MYVENSFLSVSTMRVENCRTPMIILIALNNHIEGYGNFIGIPSEWVRSLFG